MSVFFLLEFLAVNGTSNGNKAEDKLPWDDDRDAWWHEEMEDAEASCYPVWMDAEDPLFILYTRYGKVKGFRVSSFPGL